MPELSKLGCFIRNIYYKNTLTYLSTKLADNFSLGNAVAYWPDMLQECMPSYGYGVEISFVLYVLERKVNCFFKMGHPWPLFQTNKINLQPTNSVLYPLSTRCWDSNLQTLEVSSHDQSLDQGSCPKLIVWPSNFDDESSPYKELTNQRKK